MSKLTLCTRYDELGASSRLRFFAYVEALKSANIEIALDPFFSNNYLKKLYTQGRKSNFSALYSLIKRLVKAPFLPKNLLIEYELLPQLPYCIERVFLKNRQYILNFDDNVWEKYKNNPKMQNKYDQLVANAQGVIVANDFLAQKVAPFCKNIIKIPTVVDLDAYNLSLEKSQKFTLCWIGTPFTYHEYLLPFAPVLQAMAKELEFKLLIIAQDNLPAIQNVDMEFVKWSSENEAELISSAHVGIMPLGQDEFAKGKSGYKIIQYFAAGLPAIASSVGENINIITPECGFLATSQTQWIEALKALQTQDIYDKLSLGAKSRGREFSLQKYGPILADFVKNHLDL